MKISITGCANSCAKPQENDIGIMAIGKQRYKLFVGGRIGQKPSFAIPLDSYAPNEEAVIRFIGLTLDWLSERGRSKERFSAVIKRLGMKAFHVDVIQVWVQNYE